MLSCLRILTAASLAAATTGPITATAASAAERPGRPAADFSCSKLVLSTSGLARGILGCRPEKGAPAPPATSTAPSRSAASSPRRRSP